MLGMFKQAVFLFSSSAKSRRGWFIKEGASILPITSGSAGGFKSVSASISPLAFCAKQLVEDYHARFGFTHSEYHTVSTFLKGNMHSVMEILC